MSIPQWTAAWRPDIRRLLHLLQEPIDASSSQASAYAVDELQVDFYVRKLHAHVYLEPSTERMKNAAEGVVRTLEFHHRNRHAARISTIFFGDGPQPRPSLRIPTRVACLLLELANSPLSITPTELDEIDLVRIACESRSSMAFHDEQRTRAATRALVHELNELTMEDPWFASRNDDRDDDDTALWASDDDDDNDSTTHFEGRHPPPPPQPPLETESYASTKPWLLYQGYAATLEQHTTPLRFLLKTIVHEHVFVDHVLLALLGCTSTTFQATPTSMEARPFWSSMPFAAFSLAPSLPSVSHLTPACLYQSLARWSDVATSLSFIRAAAAHVGSIPASTLQGWSHALRAVVQDADRAVSTLMQLTMVETRRRPTLICLWVELQPLVDDAMWLRQVVLHMLEPCEHIQSPTTRHVTATVLSSLSGLLELYTVLDDTKHFVMLATWFRHAMKPYLARLDEFLQGHPAAVELGFESVSIATRGAFIQALFQSIQIPPSTAPPSFLVNMSSLVLEAHAYTILTRPETTPTVLPASAHPSDYPKPQTPPSTLPPWSQSYEHAHVGVPPVSFNEHMKTHLIEPLTAKVHKTTQNTCQMAIVEHGQLFVVYGHWTRSGHSSQGRVASGRPLANPAPVCPAVSSLCDKPDTSSWLSEQLVQHIMVPTLRSRWRDSYALNALYRQAIAMASMNDLYLHDAATRITLTLHNDLPTTAPGITSLNAIGFHYDAPGPLKILFRSDVLSRLSKVGILLLQVQGVERTLVSVQKDIYIFIKQTIMRKLPNVPAMHGHLVEVAAMLHFVKQIHMYFRQQVCPFRPRFDYLTGSDMWDSVGDAMEQATLVSEMNDVMEQSIAHMLERCFLLERHASMHEYLMQLVHHIVVYMACFEDILSEQLLQGNVDEAIAVSGLAAAASKFKRAHGYVIIALKSMATAGSASHLHELVLQLNYNRMFPVE
ncbi:hypothetical protein AaE_015082 [Aphanomyces astaci]|uniref:Spindle pole body component n=1 Tax=Aphanomyces astaci TaxID=112090 RepID=A0A6A4Z277_APHAT|nr:hypothetical protein AaE_015082 [Aphanomyces astaci]